MQRIKAAITGIGGYVPDYVLTNAELEKMVDTTDEWILTRTGIRERRILKDPTKGSSYLGTQAALDLIRKTGIDPATIDLIITPTATPDYLFPATANIIAREVGAINAFSYDILAACSGFLYSVATASSFIESGRYKRVLVVGADKMSTIVDYTDRSTCIIFGDGAGAIMLEPSTNGYGVEDMWLRSDGTGEEFLIQHAGGSRNPTSAETVAKKMHYLHQEGATVFKFAVTNMAQAAAEIMERNNLQADDIAWLVPHQANKRIIDATANRMGIGPEKVMINIDHFGNTTSGTIPLCLWEYQDQLKKGDKIVMAAFGGGFTWGSIYLTWAI